MARKRGKSRRSGFYRGFKKTTVPGDRGYVKPRKDGGRSHKFSKSGRVHIDKFDPAKYPAEHIVADYLGVKTPSKKRRRH
ncbi:MAG: hypothetical protein ACE5KV_06165 [Thermoplasmata archaeon]